MQNRKLQLLNFYVPSRSRGLAHYFDTMHSTVNYRVVETLVLQSGDRAKKFNLHRTRQDSMITYSKSGTRSSKY